MSDSNFVLPSLGPVGFDLARVVRDTPAAAQQVFLHSAGSSLPPEPVIERMVAHLRLEAEVGGYTAAAMVADELDLVHSRVAALFGDFSDEAGGRVALSTSAGFSSTQFVCGLGLGPGDAVLISSTEFATNALAVAYLEENVGVRVGHIARLQNGQIDRDSLQRELSRGDVRAVCLVTIPSDNGASDDVTEAAAMGRRAGALVLIDTTQSVGQLPVDVVALGADVAVMNGRKWLRGPRGTGAMWMRDGLAQNITSVLPDHSSGTMQAGRYIQHPTMQRFEYKEASIAAQLGLGIAAQYYLDLGVEAASAETQARATQLRTGLCTIKGVTVHDRGDATHPASAIISFTLANQAPQAVADSLWEHRVRVGVVGADATPFDPDLAHVGSVVRASPHYFVTPPQIDEALNRIEAIAKA